MPCWNDVGRGDYLDQITTGSEWLNLWQFPEEGYAKWWVGCLPIYRCFSMDIFYDSDMFFISNIHKDPSDWYICLPAYLLDFAVKQMVGNYTP